MAQTRSRSSVWFVLGIPFVVVGLFTLHGCNAPGSSPRTTGGGQGGAGGCPVRPPEPQFVVEIRATDGPVPADTRVVVEWSAANEPAFVLSDPTTWKTLDDGVNLVCNIDRAKPPPADLSVLVCELWTSGAVNLLIEASSFDSHTETLKPMMSEECGGPMPMEVAVLLSRTPIDSGVMP